MKFVVLLLYCVVSVYSYRSRYCEICLNHTLCKYSVEGPASACRSFETASLGDADIEEIVNRVNARRNFVALGRLKKFPQAANMRRMQWSTELASFAQRWADQCDPQIRPNKEDECRDLVGMQVGQTIAAVVGPAPGLNVRSFVDIWFTLKLRYTGSIVYYNRSLDEKTNYFTQLLWADTEYVGCGKIKFYNPEINTVVERLVCNFAPKGNNHGKPVYALGYPSTQCPKFMTPDLEFPGLCKQAPPTATEIVAESTASSLLRILDSSNGSEKQDLDPNNLRQISYNSSQNTDQRTQRIRHVYSNNSNGAIKRDSFHMMNPHHNPVNEFDSFKSHAFTPERGHSRMYHGHLTKIEPIQNLQTTQSFPELHFRRFDTTTSPDPLSIPHNHEHAPNSRRIISSQNDYVSDSRQISNSQNDYALNGRRIISSLNDYAADGRRNFGDHMCTRKPKCDDCFPKPCMANECTRGQSHSCDTCLKPQPFNLCLQPPLPPPALPFPPAPLNHDMCPCKAACLPLPPLPSPVCPVCPTRNCGPSEPASFCAKRRAQNNAHDANKSTQDNYYELFPNIGLRSGDENQRNFFDGSEIEDSLEYKAKESEINNQVKHIGGNSQVKLQQPQDSIDTLYSSERKRRDFDEQVTFKPFWQMDEYNYKRPSELKSLRYTTLADKRNRNSRRTTSFTRLPTESITIKLDEESMHDSPHRDHTTEKYLSFEELMHLRKLSTLEGLDHKIRRFEGDYLRAAPKKAAPTKAKAAVTKKAVATTKAKATTKPKETTTIKTQPPTKIAITKKPAVAQSAAALIATPAPTAAAAAGAAATAAAISTTASANTPFIRLRQCTRKITCTWTALMLLTGPDGKPLTGVSNGKGGVVYNVEVGSRTPPGYVEGCTRTSTCTRDFMDRNKMPAQTSTEATTDDSSTSEDEEYCERRSLNLQRRNLDDTDKMLSIEFQAALTEITPTTEISHVTNRGIVNDSDVLQYEYKYSDCNCYEDNSRIKRDEISRYGQLAHTDYNNVLENKTTKIQDVDDLYSMLRKMSMASRSDQIPHRCACNGTITILNNIIYIKILINYSLIWVFYNITQLS